MPPKRRLSKRLAEVAAVAGVEGDSTGDTRSDGAADEDDVDGSDDGDGSEDDRVEFEVEEILQMKGRAKIKYLIKWKGYEDPTWEPEECTKSCPEMLRAFHAKTQAATAPRPRQRSTVHIPSTAEASSDMPPAKRSKRHHEGARVEEEVGGDSEARASAAVGGLPGGRASGLALEDSGQPLASNDCARAADNEHGGDIEDGGDSVAGSFDYPDDADETGDAAEIEEVLEKREGDKGPEYRVRWTDHIESWVMPEELSAQLIDAFETTANERAQRPRQSPGKAKQATSAGTNAGKSPTALERSYIGKLVAFSPEKDTWLKDKTYAAVGTAFIVGRVSDYHYAKKKGLYEVRWLDSMFQARPEKIDVAVLRQGRLNYELLSRHPDAPRWTSLCRPDALDALDIEDAENLVEYESYDAYAPTDRAAVSLAEVEKIGNMRFDPDRRLRQPEGLYKRPDGTSKTQLKPEYKHIFEHSASSSFFAYLPIPFWRQVLQQTNEEAKDKLPGFKTPFTMSELMKFLGMLWYMALIDKGEFSRYWGTQIENEILGTEGGGLDSVMSQKRFWLLRSAFCFRKSSDISPQDSARDAAVRIRSLLNMLKQTGGRYLDVGRDLAVDEASVAARSKFARHIIMYNPRKPTGKYHFKFYMCCCATSWVALNFRLHAESTLQDRMQGLADEGDTRAFEEDMSQSSKTRQIVLEITKPFHNTGRVVNCDNYYTSVQLLEALRIKGLHCRGTVKRLSKHFPRHVVLGDPSTAEKNANKSKNKTKAKAAATDTVVDRTGSLPPPAMPSTSKVGGEVKRGDFLQAVAEESKILAASWCDGNAVTIISNADSSAVSSVTRLVKGKHIEVPAPTCIKEYNKNMQGVDRNDQMRARFSVADGHSFKKWYKKLGLAIIDIARVNAYMTRQLLSDDQERDVHREFLAELIHEMLTEKWQDAPNDGLMLFDEADHVPLVSAASSARSPSRESPSVMFSSQSPATTCSGVESAQLFAASRRKRMCIVCRFEGRKDTLLTETCIQHNVSLCKRVHDTNVPFGCQVADWTCWEKFHLFYSTKGLFTDAGCVKRGSALFKEKKAYDDLQKRTRQTQETTANDVQRMLPFVECTTPDFLVPSPAIEYV